MKAECRAILKCRQRRLVPLVTILGATTTGSNLRRARGSGVLDTAISAARERLALRLTLASHSNSAQHSSSGHLDCAAGFFRNISAENRSPDRLPLT